MAWLNREATRRYVSPPLPAQMPASVSSAASTKAAALLLKKAAVAAAAVSEEACGGHVSPSNDYLSSPFPVAFSSSSSSSTCTSNLMPQHQRGPVSHLPPPLPSSLAPLPPQSLSLTRPGKDAARSPSSTSGQCYFATHPVRPRAASLTSSASPDDTSRALRMLRQLTQEMQQSLAESTLRRGSSPGAVYATARPLDRCSPDGREAAPEESELYLSQWLPPPLPPVRPAPSLGRPALTSARKQQLRKRRQRNMTTGGLTGTFSASQTVPGPSADSSGLRNSVSFNGINGGKCSQLAWIIPLCPAPRMTSAASLRVSPMSQRWAEGILSAITGAVSHRGSSKVPVTVCGIKGDL